MNNSTQIMNAALKILSRRAHSTQELRNKLFKKEFERKDIDAAVAECQRLNLLNDRLLAEDYAGELKSKGCGPYKIKLMLYKKGIDKDIINEVAGGKENDEFQLAAEVLARKMKSLEREPDHKKRREKAFRFMISRGFSSDVIRKLLE
jgi:regulatory protein